MKSKISSFSQNAMSFVPKDSITQLSLIAGYLYGIKYGLDKIDKDPMADNLAKKTLVVASSSIIFGYISGWMGFLTEEFIRSEYSYLTAWLVPPMTITAIKHYYGKDPNN